MLPNPCLAVIFDMDGTLLDTERVYRAALTDAAAEMGKEVTEALRRRIMGLPGPDCDAVFLETFGPDFSILEFRRRFSEGVQLRLADGVPLKPGVTELLDFLEDREIPRAVATSASRRAASAYLHRCGLHPRFQVIATRDDVTLGKPRPDVFLKAAEGLGVNPAGCVALEDSFNGIRAAHAAGMAAIMVLDLLTPTEDLAALCTAVVDDLHAVRQMLAECPSPP